MKWRSDIVGDMQIADFFKAGKVSVDRIEHGFLLFVIEGKAGHGNGGLQYFRRNLLRASLLHLAPENARKKSGPKAKAREMGQKAAAGIVSHE